MAEDEIVRETRETRERIFAATRVAQTVPSDLLEGVESPIQDEDVEAALEAVLAKHPEHLHTHIVRHAAGLERVRRSAHAPQADHRLFWAATYYDGRSVYESEAPGEISTNTLDRAELKRFSMVDLDGQERFGLDFPKGDDPKLVYRRRSWFTVSQAEPVPADQWKGPDPYNQAEWSYVLGYHHADGRLEMWGMGADGIFRPDPEPSLTHENLHPFERFGED